MTVKKPSCVPQEIAEFAKDMKVFPIDIIAREGPIRYRDQGCGLEGGSRYELTSDQYVVFYQFKKFAQGITKEDLTALADVVDKVTPKERALILTTIYIFEWTHRKKSKMAQTGDLEPVLPRQDIDKSISRKQWDQWIAVIKRYTHDGEVAFPAVKVCEEELKETWMKDRQKTGHLLWHCGRPYSRCAIPISTLFPEGDSNGPEVVPEDEVLDAYSEFMVGQFQQYRILTMSIISRDGNSSKEPKTVGDIATQLLMSRLPYDDDKK